MLNTYIQVNLNNVSREEREELAKYLEENCWDFKKIEEEKGIKKEIPIEEDCEYCECGKKKKNFIHNCPGSSNMSEIYGCPVCDDTSCGFC